MPMSLHAAGDIAGVRPVEPGLSHRRATDTTEGSDMNTTHTPDLLTQASLAEIASFQGRPCLSLYQPTHRRHPDNQQDPIRFRHLVKALETSLLQQHAVDAAKALVEPFEALAQDHDFWNHTLEGLVALGAPGLFRVFLLQRPVIELAVVADSFHTKPLRQWLQSTGRYQVLALSLHKVQLFEGDRNALDAVALAAGVPQTMTAALGDEHTESHTTVSSHGGIGVGHSPMHDGQGGRKDEIDGDAERFFRAVDRAVLEHHSRPSGLPLMLAALPEHHHLFRQVSHNPFLMASGLMVDPQSLTHDAMRQRAWDVAAPQQQAQQGAWSDAYAVAAAKGLGSEDLSQVAHAAVAGRVATLLIEAERQVAGRIDGSTGRIDPAELGNPGVDDVLDDLGALVERLGGEVHVLSAERMPCGTGVAASFRY
jgi:Bacterial archaeo-eukaryotic release factor family 3